MGSETTLPRPEGEGETSVTGPPVARDPVADIDLLVVGPAGHETGGIAKYIERQERELSGHVRTRVFDVATPDGDGPAWVVRASVAALGDVLRFPFRRRPDVLHVHTSHYRSFYLSSVYVLLGVLLWGCPVVLHAHGSSFDEFVEDASPVVAALQSAVFARVDRVVVLSEYWAETVATRTDRSKLSVLPNAVSPGAYDASFDVDPPTVAFVADHVERKGVLEFVTAVEHLLERESHPSFAVHVAGAGPLSEHARTLADRREEVTYHGYVSEAEKRRLLESASVYVLPTYAEGLPIGILEAMASGNAVVSTPVGSIPDLVGPANGQLVDPGDVDQLTEALGELLATPGTVGEMARANRLLVEEEYAWPAVVERLLALYDSVQTEATTRAGGDR